MFETGTSKMSGPIARYSECPSHSQREISRARQVSRKRMQNIPELRRPPSKIRLLEIVVVGQIASDNAHAKKLKIDLITIGLNILMKHRKVVADINCRT